MPPILPWIAHLYTATGAVIALLATGDDLRAQLPRRLHLPRRRHVRRCHRRRAGARAAVKERLPHFDGAKLDDIIDYLTYVFVPALIVWQADLVPVAVSDLRGDAAVERLRILRRPAPRSTSADHFFTGFPSYWNIVVVYLYVLQLPQRTNAIILAVLAVLVFVPIRYVYPSRTQDAEGADAGAGYNVGGAVRLDDLAAAGRRWSVDADLADVSGLLLRVVAVASCRRARRQE